MLRKVKGEEKSCNSNIEKNVNLLVLVVALQTTVVVVFQGMC